MKRTVSSLFIELSGYEDHLVVELNMKYRYLSVLKQLLDLRHQMDMQQQTFSMNQHFPCSGIMTNFHIVYSLWNHACQREKILGDKVGLYWLSAAHFDLEFAPRQAVIPKVRLSNLCTADTLAP